jgi:hypothetical protein
MAWSGMKEEAGRQAICYSPINSATKHSTGCSPLNEGAMVNFIDPRVAFQMNSMIEGRENGQERYNYERAREYLPSKWGLMEERWPVPMH